MSASITAALGAAVLLAAPGCGAIMHIFSGGGQDGKKEAELSERQASVMRFADEFASRVLEAGNTAVRSIGTSAAREELRAWQISQITSAFIIAAGQNPVVNGLDLIVLTTLDHAVVQDSWVPRYGAAVQPMLEAHAWLEHKAWSLGKQMLTPLQAKELRQMIDQWRRDNLEVRSVGFVHFRDFSKSIGKQPTTAGGGGPESVFGVIGLDPFSNLDPAVRELTRNRLVAERALFYGQRLPLLLDLQISHVTREAAAMPESRQLLSDVSKVSASVARVTDSVDGLPQLVERERKAAIDQILRQLEEQEAHASALLADARHTLEVGTTTAVALDRTIRSLDELVERFEDDGAKREQPPSKPFDIDAYAAAATQISRAARDLEHLISTLDRTAPQLGASLDTASAASKEAVDHAFVRAAVLLALALLGGLCTALVYRYLAWKLQRRLS